MKLVQLKCPSCGSELNVMKNSNKAKCEFCGITTIIDDEKIVVEHQIKNNNLDIMYENSFIYLNKLKKYDEAKSLFMRLSEIRPGDPNVWEGIIRAETRDFDESFIDVEETIDLQLIESAFENYCLLTDDNNELKQKYQKYLKEINNTINTSYKDQLESDIEISHKWFFILFLVVIVFVFLVIYLTPGGESKNKLSEEELLGQNFSDEYEYIAKVKCSFFNENISQFSLDGFFINNKAYALNVDKLYSNEQNCREQEFVDSNLISGNFGEVIGENFNFDSYIYTTNKYECNYDGRCYSFSDWALGPNEEYEYLERIEKEFGFYLNDKSSYKIYQFKGTTGTLKEYVLLHNDKLYYLKLNKTSVAPNQYEVYFKIKDEIELNLDKDENIVQLTKYIRTNKAYYNVEKYKINKEACEKYADVKCQYKRKLVKDKILSLKYNDIYYVNKYLVMKDGTIYSS